VLKAGGGEKKLIKQVYLAEIFMIFTESTPWKREEAIFGGEGQRMQNQAGNTENCQCHFSGK
jgi:hypothetical protein